MCFYYVIKIKLLSIFIKVSYILTHRWNKYDNVNTYLKRVTSSNFITKEVKLPIHISKIIFFMGRQNM